MAAIDHRYQHVALDTDDAELDSARAHARTDALATLNGWGEGRTRQIGTSLVSQYGDLDNARSALMTELMRRAGYEGLKFHEG